MAHRCALIIFARQPVPGEVKTRLTPPLSSGVAARLYECMLLDTLSRTARLHRVTRFLFFVETAGARGYFDEVAADLERIPQSGRDLGERMERAFSDLFSRGFGRVAVIGTDSPDLPLARIEEAYRALEMGSDVVFGPSEDGGYYLLALRRPYPGLFRDIGWSGPTVLAESLRKAEKLELRVELLPAWYDVDTAGDLCRPELLDERTGAPLTREFVRELLKRGPLPVPAA